MEIVQQFLKETILPAVWQRRPKDHGNVDEEIVEYTDPSVQLVSVDSDAESHDGTENVALSPIRAFIRQNAWDAVLQECLLRGEAVAGHRDHPSGNTLLHDVFESTYPVPVYVLVEILDLFPEHASVRNADGCLPLHMACTARASPQIVEALIQAYPDGINLANDAGWYPLHMLCRYGCHVECIRIVLETSVSSVRRIDRVFCRTPVQLLNASKNLKSFHSSLDQLRCIRQRQRDTDYLSPSDTLALERLGGSELWKKVKLLVLAESLQRPLIKDDEKTNGILHSFIAIQSSCPPALLEFAILLHVDELGIPNEVDGNLPLHTAAALSNPSSILDVLLPMPTAARRMNSAGQVALQIVLQRFPTIPWCTLIESLIVANPIALEALNVDVRLYPLVLARIAYSDDNKSGRDSRRINQLFEMISAGPTLFCKS